MADFTSDVGRKKFGFSHEEIDDSTAYYEGQFKLHQRCGEGTLHSPETGAKYVGQFQNDQFHGQGSQIWPDGSRYKGQWKKGQKHGKGEYTSSDELVYDGQWESGLRHGQGKQEYANSDRYEGWWYRGMCSGPGTYYFADGSRYDGAWANGRYDGMGVLYGADGTCERHRYSNGLLVTREVLPHKLSRGTRQSCIHGTAVLAQSREDMHKPTLRSKSQASRYLINRETAGMDLSAPPLAPQSSQPTALADGNVRMETPASKPCVSVSADGEVHVEVPLEWALPEGSVRSTPSPSS